MKLLQGLLLVLREVGNFPFLILRVDSRILLPLGAEGVVADALPGIVLQCPAPRPQYHFQGLPLDVLQNPPSSASYRHPSLALSPRLSCALLLFLSWRACRSMAPILLIPSHMHRADWQL